MKRPYKSYLIGLTDQFDPASYTTVNDEIGIINKKTEGIPTHFKAEIIISFLKNHSLQANWIDANPELAELASTQVFFTGSIEALFDSCRNNPVFTQDLEAYLKEK